MPTVVKNYYYEKGKLVIADWCGIFVDMPTAVCEFGVEYKDPVLLELENKQTVIFERTKLEELIQAQKDKSENEGSEE